MGRARRSAATRNEGSVSGGCSDCVPVRGVKISRPWQGVLKEKPWEYEVTVAIPHLDTPETMAPLVELFSLQTVKPYIVIIDTGSLDPGIEEIRRIVRENDNVEAHFLRFRGVKHPSDPVAIAMDLAFSLCPTDYLFATHADCFPRRRDLLQRFLYLSRSRRKAVVGYQITPRHGIDTSRWVGHTATLFDMLECDRLNLGWSQRRYCSHTGISHFGSGMTNGQPDTEFLLNWQLQQAGIEPLLVGKEENYVTTRDANIMHVRSYASAKQYSETYFAKSSPDMESAIVEAKKHAERWKND